MKKQFWIGVAIILGVVLITCAWIVVPVVRASSTWYVSPTGSDSANCAATDTPCLTMNGALAKGSFAAGDTIKVEVGTYTAAGNQVVLIEKDVLLSGGWNSAFTTQTGTSTIDGQNARQGIMIQDGVGAVTIERFTIENGSSQVDQGGSGMGAGIETYAAALTINNSTLHHNSSLFMGGGIVNFNGNVTLNHTNVISNTSEGDGAGIKSSGGTLTLNHVTISENHTWNGTAGVAQNGDLVMTDSLVTRNESPSGGGSGLFGGGVTTISDSIISENVGFGAALILEGNASIDNVHVENNQARGIDNDGITVVTDSVIQGNQNSGISNSNELSISNSTIAGNQALDFGEGGGIRNFGKLTLDHVLVSNNSANTGGGIYVHIGGVNSADIRDSTITGNSAVFGAGIDNGNIVTLTRTTIHDNEAFEGGGIANHATLNVHNSTISSNRVTGGSGGGIHTDGGQVRIHSTTIAANSETNASMGGGMYQSASSTVDISNSIIAANTASEGPDCAGAINSDGYNLVGTVAGCTLTLTPYDLTGIVPLIGPLQDNGGATLTHALFALSPAIDHVSAASCTDHLANPLTQDQRMFPRPLDGNGDAQADCDAGAYEFDPADCAGTKPDHPRLLKPAKNAVAHKQRVKLNWGDIFCATSFRLVVRRDSKTGPVVENAKGLTKSKFKTDTLTGGESYYWQVKACNGTNCKKSKWSSFSVAK